MRILLILLMAALAMPAAAQERLAPETVAAMVAETNRLLKENYLYPDKTGAITSKLSASLANGRYAVSDPHMLAERITQDFLAVTNDGHMNVSYDPARAKALAAPQQGRQAPSREFARKMLRASNFGVKELKVLPGNVRYANISTFAWDAELSPPRFDEAIRFLRGADAYILDIRTNGGGAAEGVAYLISHFMEPDKTLMKFYSARGNNETKTLKTLPAGRLEPKPLYLLTSKGSFSAAEEFAAHVKNFKLGTLVGETTGGGGNNNEFFPTPQGFVVSISYGRAEHPATGRSWEGEGIVADVQVPASAALDRAHMEALKTLRDTADPQDRKGFSWAIEALEARMKPMPLPAAAQQAFVGSYAGKRKVVAREDKLFWQLDGAEWEMLPMSQDLFGLTSGPPLRLRFTRDGNGITGVSEVWQSGKEDIFPKAS